MSYQECRGPSPMEMEHIGFTTRDDTVHRPQTVCFWIKENLSVVSGYFIMDQRKLSLYYIYTPWSLNVFFTTWQVDYRIPSSEILRAPDPPAGSEPASSISWNQSNQPAASWVKMHAWIQVEWLTKQLLHPDSVC